jgi:hypothetical protein
MTKEQQRKLPFRTNKRFPKQVIHTAREALEAVLSEDATPGPRRWFIERCTCSGGWFEVVRIDYKHRLVRTKRRPAWELLNHQEYDKLRA